MKPTKLGIVGCGNISDAYFKGAARSQLVSVAACADLNPEAARAKAAEYGAEAKSLDALLDDPEIVIVVNLTVPIAHAEVSARIIEAGKHVYSEKPLGITVAEAKALVEAAAAKGVRVGSAPDTFLGASHQAVRRAVDAGRIGRVVTGAVCFATHGMESWHPNPTFFFKRGGGPVLDIGCYPITQLLNVLGPVARVTAEASRGSPTRTVTSEPLKGQVIEVEVSTTVNGVLAFANGANIAFTASWDIWKHTRPPIELHGTEGSILNPDPNFFGGTPRLSEGGQDWQDLSIEGHPFGVPNRALRSGAEVADYRLVGVLDMAAAIAEGRPHRCSGDLALHALEVMEALELASLEGRHIAIRSPGARPAAVPLGADEAVFSGEA